MEYRDSVSRFDDRVDDYVRSRPGYPTALIDLLRRVCNLTPGCRVGDIGSGTGLLASSTFAPARGTTAFHAMAWELDHLFRINAANGRVTIEYDTVVYYGRLA